MQKIALPKVLVIIAFILVSIIAVSNVSFAHPLATKYVTVTAKNDPGGTVEISYTYNGITYGPYKTTSVKTIKIPSGATVTFTAIPENGFGFYGWNYTFEPYSVITSSTQFTFSSSQSLTFSNVQNSITAIAFFPVKLTIIDPAIWDYITTSQEYFISFVGGLAFANNGSLVPPSLVSQNTFTLNVEVQAVGSSNVVSGSVSLLRSGSVLYYANKQLFSIYDPNGLEMKYAYITWTSPKPWLYESGIIWGANDWAWGIEVTIKPGESTVSWALPFQNLNFQLTGQVLPSTSKSVYFPAGSSPSFYDTPASGYAFLNWYMIESTSYSGHEFISSSNPWTYNLPSNSFAQAYNGPFFKLIPNVVNTSVTFDVTAPSGAEGDSISLTLTFPDGSSQTQTQNLQPVDIKNPYTVAKFTWTGIPAGSYSWSITPSITYSTGFGTATANASPSSGSFTLSSTNNGTFEQGISYLSHTYTVTFTESGLPNGITWWAKLGTVEEQNTTPNPIIFTGLPQDAVFSYEVENPIVTNNGWTKYQTSQATGTVGVGIQNITQQITYNTYYLVNVIFNPNYGTSNPSSAWVQAGGGETFEMTPEEDYYIAQPYSSSITAPSGISINYNSISKTTSGNTYVYNVPVTVNAPGNITVSLTWFNFIDYISESGLPSGQSWSFVIYQNGQEQSSHTVYGSPISIEEPGYDYSANNYYQYAITFSVINAGNGIYYVPTSISTSAVDVLSKTGNSVTFEITGNSENNTNIITVTYSTFYAVTINAGQGGSVSWYNKTGSVWIPSSGFVTSGIVNAGQSQTIYVTSNTELQLTDNPNSGYAFTSWSFSGYVSTTETYYRDNTANPIDIVDTGGTGSVTATYQVYLNMISNPSGAGSLSPSSGWYNIGAQVKISATANSGYKFVSWSGSGSSSYTGTNNPETITLNSPVNETANFNVSITFSANGLNSNAQGTVLTVNGQSYTYSQLPVTFYASPGSSFSFSWSSPISGGSGAEFVWISTSGLSTSQSGTVTVSTPGSVTASYNEYYALTINAGSDGSVSWSVLSGSAWTPSSGIVTSGTVNTGQSQTVYVTWGAELQLTDNPNSGYAFSSWSFSGYVAPAQGYSSNNNPIDIDNTGSGTGSVSVTYQYSDYLQFTVSTTANSAIGFTITLSNGQSQSGNTLTQSTVTFYLPYGTYQWSISPTSQTFYDHNVKYVYVAVPSSSSATTNATVTINYALSSATFNYTWSESGLPSGTQWGVSVNGINYTTKSSSITETFNKGQTYSWNVINPTDYSGSPASGSFSSPNSTSITFTQTGFQYTWTESGLPSGTKWGVQVNGQSYYTTGTSITETFTTGQTYSWGVINPSGYLGIPSTGSFSSSGSQTINFYSASLSVTASASTTSGTQPLSVTYTATASGGSGSYYYTLYVNGTPEGNTVGPTSGSATIPYTFTQAGTYNTYIQVQDAKTQQTANSQTITITVKAPANTYSLTFNETGLPTTYPLTGDTVDWKVTVNGNSQSAPAGQTITFTGLSGTANWSVESPIKIPINKYGDVKTYYAHPPSGTASSSQTINIKYSTSSDPPSVFSNAKVSLFSLLEKIINILNLVLQNVLFDFKIYAQVLHLIIFVF